MKNILLIVLLLFVSGCTIGVPRLVKCDTGDQAIQECGEVVDIKDIHKVADLEIKYLQQQGNYKECKERHEKLIKMIEACNAAIDEHNNNLDEIIDKSALLYAKDVL